MFDISNELKDKITELNEILIKKYKPLLKKKEDLRNFINVYLGEIKKISKLNQDNLKKYLENGGIVGVDGSKNRLGGAYPHFVELYQGMAKSTVMRTKPIYTADFYTPLYLDREKDIMMKADEESLKKEEMDNFVRNYKLSKVELDVAIESTKKLKPCVIMMDGSLIRYKIEASDKWNELRKECEEKGIILIGVIKDIKTNIIGDSLIENGLLPNTMDYLYDRELLYGVLEYGEMIKINKEKIGKYEKGISSCFIRASNEPTVIGMDILISQEQYIEEMAQLVYTLTPKMSRGVPLWLDIIDSEVRISDKMMYQILEKYLDRELLEKLFIPERRKRTL